MIRLICAAILCGIATTLVTGKTTNTKLIRLLCGIYMTVCVIAPVAQIKIADFSAYLHQFDISADAAIQRGQEIADIQTAAIIKSNTETYILDKASSMGLSIDVEVTLSDSVPLVPYEASLTGTVAPIHKRQLQDWIENELGIEKEHQKWK